MTGPAMAGQGARSAPEPRTLRRTAPPPEAAKANLVDLAYEAIKRAVLENTYPPGYQAGEVEIARQLDMSRTPVHEAMARLQEEGFVRILPKRGIVVLGLSPDDIDQIYDVISALEGAAGARIAALPKAERTRIARKLEGHTAAMSAALAAGDRIAWAQADKAFHDALAADCRNGRLSRIVGTVTDQLHRARMFTLNLRPLPTHSAVEHQALTDAILAGDAEAADRAARAHRQQARDQLLPLLRQLNLSNL
ncbi:GntR family transcriptional regulator [Azorhizobium oxalatiphilum]|nr:GntR family transcriptional regulator [Azorhizobium oxalatiphilum]